MTSGSFKMKSGGSSVMLPPPTGCEPREGRRWAVIALAHLELAVQATRPRLSCEAVVRDRSGAATAQPASTSAPAAKTTNVNVFDLADAAGPGAIHCLPSLLAFACSLGAAA